MTDLMHIYNKLYGTYGPQGWWPIINKKTLLCEYPGNAPGNGEEAFEIAIGCILAQNTQWYPNVVRSLQQLKIGRPFTKEELRFIQQKELLYYNKTNGGKNAKIDRPNISKKQEIITENNILTQNTNWRNVERALLSLKMDNCVGINDVLKIDGDRLGEIIKSSGFYRQKGERLKILAEFISGFGSFEKFVKNVKREELMELKGVGYETCDSILLYACNKPYFVIDAYTKRLCNKFGVIKKNYDDYRLFFESGLPRDLEVYKEFHALIVVDGKAKDSFSF